MRRATLILGLIVLVSAGVLFVAARPEVLSHVGIGNDSVKLRQLTKSFLEDIQYKDFDKAARYHSPDEQDTVDIPFLIERVFLVKPELIDIMAFEIVFAEVDSSDRRGRVKARIKAKDLVRKKIRERDLMLYYYRNAKDGPWFMRLESSLRALRGDSKKKH